MRCAQPPKPSGSARCAAGMHVLVTRVGDAAGARAVRRLGAGVARPVHRRSRGEGGSDATQHCLGLPSAYISRAASSAAPAARWARSWSRCWCCGCSWPWSCTPRCCEPCSRQRSSGSCRWGGAGPSQRVRAGRVYAAAGKLRVRSPHAGGRDGGPGVRERHRVVFRHRRVGSGRGGRMAGQTIACRTGRILTQSLPVQVHECGQPAHAVAGRHAAE
jgi:hypothetical protein